MNRKQFMPENNNTDNKYTSTENKYIIQTTAKSGRAPFVC